jgi:hypothetical protein
MPQERRAGLNMVFIVFLAFSLSFLPRVFVSSALPCTFITCTFLRIFAAS